MIITRKFVFIAFPKTGSTFVRKTLTGINEINISKGFRKILNFQKTEDEIKVLKLPNIRIKGDRSGKKDEHGLVCQIPEEHKHLPVVSCIRNPFERLVSSYLYADWKNPEYYGNKRDIITNPAFRHFPDFSFSEYVNFIYEWDRSIRFSDMEIRKEIGMQTIQFIQFFDHDPIATLMSYSNNSKTLEQIAERFSAIRFIHTENLNQELYDLLIDFGYKKRNIGFILKAKKINKSDYKKPWEDYYTPELRDWVGEKEKFILELFPEYKNTC